MSAIIPWLVGHRMGPHGDEPIFTTIEVDKFRVYFTTASDPKKVRTRMIKAEPGMTGQDAMQRVRELVPGAKPSCWTPQRPR
jgi:hypothetical protein